MNNAPSCFPLLATESEEEVEARRAELESHLHPGDALERIYFNEFFGGQLNIWRWQRAAIAGANLGMQNALYELLVEKLGALEPGQETVRHLARWFTDVEVRREIFDLLAKYNLNESVIEAEAFRQLGADLTKFDCLTASAEARRDKALHTLAALRNGLGEKLKGKTIELVAEKGAPRLESAASSS